jgi:tetratricopeptide (TPR) repeat protein
MPPHVYFLLMVAFIPLLLLSLANPHQAVRNDSHGSFEQIARKADEARTADHPENAIALYSEGLRLNPRWNDGWWWLGSVLYDQDRFPEAEKAFAHFVNLQRSPGPAYAFLALCEYENRNYDRALQHFQAWLKNGSPGDDALLDVAGYHWALLLTRQGRFAEALYLLAAKAKKLGATPALVEAMGLSSLRMANLPEDYPREQREPVWLAGNAALYAALDDSDRSDEFARRLESRYGGEANVHYFIGTLYGFKNKLPEAAEEYKKELQISPKHVPAMTELALAFVRESQPEEAVPFAKQAVALAPNDARARYALGKSLLDTNSFEESARELEIAKRLAPGSPMVRSALSSAYRHLGRIQEAKREAAAFLSLKDKEESLAPFGEKETDQKNIAPDRPESRR